MRLVMLSAIILATQTGTVSAGIVEGERRIHPPNGIAVPEGKAPTRLECWIDGRRQVVEVDPAQLPPANAETPTRVVIHNSDGTSVVVVVPGSGVSGCLPLR